MGNSKQGDRAICGIAGYIGQSKKPKLTYHLISELFSSLEARGTDAAGVWATEIGDGRVVYHKEPIRSSEFVQKKFWQNLRSVKTNLMLVHARATSGGNGHAIFNANNHPFVSKDRRIGMIHNGTLSEFSFLQDQYETESDTDSEILLRMYEHGLEKPPLDLNADEEIVKRMTGIKDIWSLISDGAMAVSFGERVDADTRYLILFRNEKRPIWICDLRLTLGQIFFFSSPDIWYRAISRNDDLRPLCSGSQSLIEIPSGQIWIMKISADHPMMTSNEQVVKVDVNVGNGKEWKPGSKLSIPGKKMNLSMLTGLTDDDEVQTELMRETTVKQQVATHQQRHKIKLTNDDYDLTLMSPRTQHLEVCRDIRDVLERIEVLATNASMEGLFNCDEYTQLLTDLEQTHMDLSGTLEILGG